MPQAYGRLGRTGGVLSRVVISVLPHMHFHAMARQMLKMIRKAGAPGIISLHLQSVHHPPTTIKIKTWVFCFVFGLFGLLPSGVPSRSLTVLWVGLSPPPLWLLVPSSFGPNVSLV